jgi:hypothetical protein
MRNLFRSGAAFMIVAAISLLAAVLGVVKGVAIGNMNTALVASSLGSATLWFVIGLAVRAKNKAKDKADAGL